MIYGFSLSSKTSKILSQLKNVDSSYVVFLNNLDKYLEIIIHNQPKYILGLGSYSGIDNDEIRIEQVCTNKFRNNTYDGNPYKEIQINSFIKPSSTFKYASGIGNSYCNLISYKIMSLIEEKRLPSQYTFLHIPKSMNHFEASKEIDKALKEFQ